MRSRASRAHERPRSQAVSWLARRTRSTASEGAISSVSPQRRNASGQGGARVALEARGDVAAAAGVVEEGERGQAGQAGGVARAGA